MIATRKLVIDAMEARMAADPDFLNEYSVKELGTSIRMRKYDKHEFRHFYTKQPIVSFYHDKSMDEAVRLHKKYAWPVRTFDLPLWGTAQDLQKKFQ